jgi:hypothetical protein
VDISYVLVTGVSLIRAGNLVAGTSRQLMVQVHRLVPW